MAELKNLQCTRSVKEYYDAFDAIASRLIFPKGHLLSMYIGGFNEETKLSIKMFNPTTIQQASQLAKLQEATKKAKKKRQPPWKPALLPTPSILKPTTSNPTSTKTAYTNYKQNPNPRENTTTNPNRTLTPAEFEEKRAQNQCFWCDEPYTLGHRCKGKRPQLYHIDLEEEEGGEEEEKTLEGTKVMEQCAHISIQAMDGMTAFHTMRVIG